MARILGISAFYHDSAAALLEDGRIVAAAHEERFSRVKHDPRFPQRAIEYCLDEAGITPEQLDYVGFYDKPLLKFERLLETYLAFAPAGFRSFLTAMPLWLNQKLYLRREITRGLQGRYRKRIVFARHHESHAASAFFPSPFDEAAILTLDGVGEWSTATAGFGRGNRVELTHEMRFPHSLGLLYSAFTYYTGFRVNSGEYKLMGLAPYGEPRFVDVIFDKLLDLKADGSFRLNLDYFNYCQGLTMTSSRFDRLFDRKPRRPESELSRLDMDLAASIQKVTEEIVLRAGRWVHQQTGLDRLCMAGGVALNCVANGRLLDEGPFGEIWVQPAAGDAGGALGVALLIWHQLLANDRKPERPDGQQGSLLGPRFDTSEVAACLDANGARYQVLEPDLLDERVVALMASGKVVGWMQGRLEFGPRALGSRSILGDARSVEMQTVMNLKIKFRESFRPFAPSVLEERSPEVFAMPRGAASPYMLFVAPVRESLRRDPADPSVAGLDKLKQQRSDIPAVTHVDYSARLQTVGRERHPRYHRLLSRFEQLTGCPVVVNTSFNVRGEPIVCTPQEAYDCFMATDMDALAIENCLLLKEDQPASRIKREEHLARFELD